MKKKTVAIIQARMGSSRLPNKMMLHLHGYPIIEWVYRRVKKATLVDEVVVAIPDTPKDAILKSYLEKIGAEVFQGSEQNVLDRFYQAAKQYHVDYIVRVCADNPLISPREIDHLIEFYLQNDCDYAYNHIPKNNHYPDGLGAEIIAFSVLEQIHTVAFDKRHQEHIFTYINDYPERFLIKTFDPIDQTIAFPSVKLDLDTYQDYQLLLSKKIDIDMEAPEIVSRFV